MGNANILCLIHHGEIEDHLLGLRNCCRQRCKELRVCDQTTRLEPSSNALEDRPQHLTLCLWEPCLSAETSNIAVCVPIPQLPGIDHLLPLCEQEMLAELVTLDRTRGLADEFAYDLA